MCIKYLNTHTRCKHTSTKKFVFCWNGGWDGEGCPMTLEEAEEKDIKDDVCPKCVTKGIKIKEPIAEKEVKKEVKKETLKPVETNGVEHDEDEGGVKLEYHPYTGRLITGQDPWFEAGW